MIHSPVVDRLKIFYSYSHKDEKLLQKLEAHMSSLRKSQAVDTWQDGLIGAGSEWRREIGQALDEADIILLLLSSDFLASEFIQSVELKRAIERHQKDRTLIIPIKLRPCDVKGTVLEEFQWIPRGSKAVTEWPNRDRAFVEIVERIRTALGTFRPSKQDAIAPPIPAARAAQGTGAASAGGVQTPPQSGSAVAAEKPVAAALHQMMGPNQFHSPLLLTTLLKRAHAVARLELEGGAGMQTGVLVRLKDFEIAESGEALLTVNYSGAGMGQLVSAYFELDDIRVPLGVPIWQSRTSGEGRGAQLIPVAGLPSSIQPCPLSDVSRLRAGEAVFVISYPLGGPLALSMRDTRIVSVDDQMVHYFASTQPGSSGGAVLDEDCNLVGIHNQRRPDGSKSGLCVEGIIRAAAAGS